MTASALAEAVINAAGMATNAAAMAARMNLRRPARNIGLPPVRR
jgi:hypothetical protein